MDPVGAVPVRAGGGACLRLPSAEREREALEVEATVREALPNALFRVELASGARGAVVAHVAGDSSLLRLRPGDRVRGGDRALRRGPRPHRETALDVSEGMRQ